MGQNTAQFALFGFLAAGESGFMQGYGDKISYMNVPGSGDNLDRLAFVVCAGVGAVEPAGDGRWSCGLMWTEDGQPVGTTVETECQKLSLRRESPRPAGR